MVMWLLNMVVFNKTCAIQSTNEQPINYFNSHKSLDVLYVVHCDVFWGCFTWWQYMLCLLLMRIREKMWLYLIKMRREVLKSFVQNRLSKN